MPSSRQRALSRDIILSTALDLVDEEGLSALSLRSLGKRLGVSQAAFYRHFPDKAALLEGIAEQVWRLTFEAFLDRVDAGSVGVAATPTREASGPTGGHPGLAPADVHAHLRALFGVDTALPPGRGHAATYAPDVDTRAARAPGASVRDARPARFHAERGHAGAGQRRVDLHDGVSPPRSFRPWEAPPNSPSICRQRARLSTPRMRRCCVHSSRISLRIATISSPSLSEGSRQSCAAGTESVSEWRGSRHSAD